MSILAGWTPANRIALAALAGAAVLAAATAAQARRLDPLPGTPAPRRAAAMPVVTARAAAAGDAVILAAVARDPFRADRRRPPGRYRMPGEPAPAPEAPANAFTPPPPPPALRLLGTVVLADGSGLAALAGQNGQSRVVRVGQSMDGFRLLRVTRGTATLRGSDTTLVLKSGGTE